MLEKLLRIKSSIGSFIRDNLVSPTIIDKSSKFYSVIPGSILKSKYSTICIGVQFLSWDALEHFGNFNFIGDRAIIDHCKSIGSYCSISMDVKIGLRNHSLDTVCSSPFFYRKSKGFGIKNSPMESRATIIEHDVLISANTIVLEGVKLSTGCVVAAGAVVVSDVPPYAIVGGVPAKILKYRFSEEIIDALLISEWWNCDLDKIKNASSLFNDPLKFIEEIKN